MITNHVTSLEVSKRLAPHLPVGWESEFYWERQAKCGHAEKRHVSLRWSEWEIRYGRDLATERKWLYVDIIPAPLLSEMLELLPKRIDTEEDIRGYYLQVNMFPNSILIGYSNIEYNWMDGWIKTEKDNAATAAAELFLWVKENGHIKEGA